MSDTQDRPPPPGSSTGRRQWTRREPSTGAGERQDTTVVTEQRPDAARSAGSDTTGSRRAVRRLVRRRAIIRRIDPWSVLKLSLIFYVCMLAVVMLALTMFWAIINRIGLLDTVLSFLTELRLEVQLDGGNLARAALLLGLLNVVLWSGVNVFLAFLYNLVADLAGGLKVTLAEEE